MKPGKQQKPIASVNELIAGCFDEIADLLSAHRSTDFRIETYRRGAAVLRELLCPVDRIYEDSGRRGLEEIPHIGRSLARSIEKYLQIGSMPTLELLRGNGYAKRFLRSAPDPNAAPRQPVEVAQKRAEVAPERIPPQPLIGELLSIDAEYRKKAAADELVRIAPRQFNPDGTEWLPILHTPRGRWHYTAAFSNTAHAHEEGKTHDWVIIHRDARNHSGQWTVITSMFGKLKGRRIIRGWEAQCELFYHDHPEAVNADERFETDHRPHQKLLFDD